jgi:hypothetical protein
MLPFMVGTDAVHATSFRVGLEPGGEEDRSCFRRISILVHKKSQIAGGGHTVSVAYVGDIVGVGDVVDTVVIRETSVEILPTTSALLIAYKLYRGYLRIQ